jgi:hypothetical protein
MDTGYGNTTSYIVCVVSVLLVWGALGTFLHSNVLVMHVVMFLRSTVAAYDASKTRISMDCTVSTMSLRLVI